MRHSFNTPFGNSVRVRCMKGGPSRESLFRWPLLLHRSWTSREVCDRSARLLGQNHSTCNSQNAITSDLRGFHYAPALERVTTRVSQSHNFARRMRSIPQVAWLTRLHDLKLNSIHIASFYFLRRLCPRTFNHKFVVLSRPTLFRVVYPVLHTAVRCATAYKP